MRRIRVLCVDDHPVVRQGIAAIAAGDAGLEMVAEASTGEEAVEQFARHRPDVTLMDLHLPGMSGVDAIVAIRGRFPDARIVVLTTEAGDVHIQRALDAGARGYLLKGMGMADLLEVIRAVHAGRVRVPGPVASRVAEHLADQPLTEREIEVLRLVAEGLRNREIALALAISEETVKMHLKHVLTKLDASDRTHAVTIALRRGFLTL